MKPYIFILLCLLKTTYLVGQEADLIYDLQDFSIAIDGDDFSDQQEKAFDQIFDNIVVFGFGEATHGTSEFSKIKIEFFKYLVENKKVNNFALEANVGNCIAINQYIHGENFEDPSDLLKDLNSWLYYTEEFLSLVEWMKNYNETRGQNEKLNFYGVDIRSAKHPAHLLLDFIKKNPNKVEDDHYKEVLEIYSSGEGIQKLKKKDFRNQYLIMKSLKEELTNTLVEVEMDFLNPVQLVTYVIQHIQLLITNDQHERDKAMADNISWIVEKTGMNQKVFVWSHNFHVKKNNITFSSDLAMGHHLKNKFGNAYYSMGFDFGVGNFNAVNRKERRIERFEISEPIKKSSSNFFYLNSTTSFLLDFEKVDPSSPLYHYLNSKVVYQAIGANYEPRMVAKEKLVNAYDGIIFIRKTTATTFL